MCPNHISMLTEEEIATTNNGKTIHIWRLNPCIDNEILSEWATYFRRHYCSDDELETDSKLNGLSKEKYLTEMKFPNRKDKLGNAARSGDFCEILVADYAEYILNYTVPRTRYDRKVNPNSSTQGSDLLGFKLDKVSSNNELVIFEIKGQASNTKPKNRLQDAVNDSKKDKKRLAFSLNAMNQRLRDKGLIDEAKVVQRFQNATDRPYKTKYAAAAVHSDYSFSTDLLNEVDTSHHVDPDLYLLVIHRQNLMTFIHELYERASKC